ncbi:MAG: ferritin family protein [Desulfobacteraceae bacterium]
MDFNNLDEIIDFAIAKEIEAEKQALLEDQKSGKVGKSVDEYRLKWVTDIKRSNYVHEVAYRPGMAYQEILMLACKREEKALALYNELQVKAETEDAKRVFMILCQEEAKHKLALETMYDDYMAEMGD